MKNLTNLIFFPIFICSLIACQSDINPKSLLNEVINKQSKSAVISYNYKMVADNLFNETTYSDSSKITYYKVKNRPFDFGFHILNKQDEYLFDGHQFEKLKHDEKIRVQYDDEKIKNDSSYFDDYYFLSPAPMSIKDDTDFESIDTIIQEQAHLVYKKENLSKSKLDSNDIIIYQQFFYVDVKTKEVNQIQEITYKNNQVLQIINHYYSNYNYSKPVELLSNFKKTALTYKIIREEEEEFTYTPIAEGAQLTKKAYMDINQTEIEIYGKAGVSSLIMFSFIGCAPCEMALRDFKAVNYDFKAPINLYYSSFQNKSAVLKKYLKGKGFPFKAFGQESNMIEDFSLYTAPSFALIDSDGKILKVIEGYSENVKDTLMGILEPTL